MYLSLSGIDQLRLGMSVCLNLGLNENQLFLGGWHVTKHLSRVVRMLLLLLLLLLLYHVLIERSTIGAPPALVEVPFMVVVLKPSSSLPSSTLTPRRVPIVSTPMIGIAPRQCDWS